MSGSEKSQAPETIYSIGSEKSQAPEIIYSVGSEKVRHREKFIGGKKNGDF